MRLHGYGAAVMVALLLLGNVATGQVVFSDDFDGPTTFFRARQNFDSLGVHPPDVGVDPWQQNGVLRDGSDPGYPAPGANGGTFYAQPGSPRLQGQLTSPDAAATFNKVVNISWDMYLKSTTGGLSNSFELGSWDTGYLAGPRGYDLFFKPDGTLDVYTNSGGFVTAPSFSFATDQWVSPSMTIDYATGAASLTIGAQTTNFTVADLTAHRLDVITFQDYSGGANLALFDNFTVAVPEPASLSLLGVAALGLMRRRRS